MPKYKIMPKFNFDFKKYMFLDDELKPAYECPVCGNIGLIREHETYPDKAELCRYCGAPAHFESNIDVYTWSKIWHDHGSKVLRDLPYDERLYYVRMIAEEYSTKHIYIPSEADIRDLDIEERAFTQHLFKKVIDPDKKIVVETSVKKVTFPYVTNTIYKLDGDRVYIAVAEKYNSKILFLSNEFQYNDDVYRTAYIGLLPDIFRWSMCLDETCEVEDNDGKRYVIYVE